MEAVIFDMDGLLVDSEPFWRQAEINCFKTVGVELTEEKCKLTMGMRIDEVVSFWYDKQPWKGKDQSTLTEEIVDEMVRLMEQEGVAMEGVFEIIQLCKKLNLKMALASSSKMRLIDTVVRRLELKEYLEVIRSAETERYGKPHPGVFLTAAEELKVAPEKCIVLEDSFHGVVAGVAAKMKVIAVPDAEDFEQEKFVIADYKVRSLKEITVEMLIS